METTAVLRERHRRALEAVFAHPTAHNLAWADVLALIDQVGAVTHEGNGKLRTAVGGRSVRWEPEDSQLTEAEVLAMRRFLQGVGVTPDTDAAAARGPRRRERLEPGARTVVVMTYRDATVYGAHGTVVIAPDDPRGRLKVLHEKSGTWRGFYQLPQPEYFARIADELRRSDAILLMGHGKGHSNAMLHLLGYLERHEPQIAEHVLGGIDADVGDLTEAQIDDAVREFFNDPEVRPRG